jgi:XTP/dITP diphosphohydrolase
MPDSMQKLVIATSNPGKFREIMEVLSDIPYKIISSKQLKLNDNLEEDGKTYKENALKKVSHYWNQTGFLTLAEDSGITVDALSGELGVKTRRWGAGENVTDEEWIDYFLKTLESVPDEQRTARFICCAALMDEKGDVHFFEGKTEGMITRNLEAPIYAGLPISSCFRPEGFDKVYAALTVAEKNRISHRGKAMYGVKEILESHCIADQTS